MAYPENQVSDWYRGKTIFITGASGFMGKVLIEKLLYACPGLNKIYALMRPKRGKSVGQRVEDMFKLPVSNLHNIIVIMKTCILHLVSYPLIHDRSD